MKFAVDNMLGKLARWLRMMGFDVSWSNQVSDDEVVRQGREERRMILTRDTRLIRRLRSNEFLFIRDDLLENQMREVFTRFPELLQEKHPLSRCVECNVALEDIAKADVKDRVWPYVYQTQERFRTCPNCRRIFWEATHVEKIRRRLLKL